MLKTQRDADIDADPILTFANGRMAYLFPSGRTVPVIWGGDGPEDEKIFTKAEHEAEVNRVVQERLNRAKSEPPADYAQLKADSAELAKLKAANQTAEDAQAARIEKLEQDIAAATAAGEKAAGDAKEEKRRSAVIAAAAAAKAADPDDVWALLAKDAVTIGDDGKVTGAEAAVKALLEAKPHLVGKAANPKPDPGQGKGGSGKGFGEGGRAEAQKRFGTPVPAGATQQ